MVGRLSGLLECRRSPRRPVVRQHPGHGRLGELSDHDPRRGKKHASCTDKNGDGVYTPGYDVKVRINDAWGVRDVLGQGVLFSGGFESWFAETGVPKHRVYPRYSIVPAREESTCRRANWLVKITEFWGLRIGIRWLAGTEFKSIGYVFELGAGAF